MLFDRAPALEASALKSYAAELGLNAAQFDSCLDSSQYRAVVQLDYQDAISRGFPGTPTFLINDKPFVGAPSFAYLQSLIDSLLGSGG